VYSGSLSPVTQGPAWVEADLTDSFYNNFADPAIFDYSHANTNDSHGGPNVNDTYGLIKSSYGFSRAGIYLGWSFSPDNFDHKVPTDASIYKPALPTGPGEPLATNLPPSFIVNTPFRVELQYEDPNNMGTWHTYQRWENLDGFYPAPSPNDPFMEYSDPQWSNVTSSGTTSYVKPGTTATTAIQPSTADYTIDMSFDPRTPRHNLAELHNENVTPPPQFFPANTTVGLPGGTLDALPGAEVGIHFPNSTFPYGRSQRNFWAYWFDNYDTTNVQRYYNDRDSLKRVGDGGGWSTANPTFNPLVPGQTLGRPLFLGRPFRSVGELGYVFRDDPWKSLNLISANSGDSGLLDLFYVGSGSSSAPTQPAPDIIDGKMNINSAAMNAITANGSNATSPGLVLQALISQAVRTYTTTGTAYVVSGTVSASDTQALAVTGTNSVINYIKSNGPLTNIGDLPAIFPQNNSTPTENPGIKQQREAFVRALADSSGTRTWNLMIDIIAQAGKYSTSAGTLDQFTVEGEKHYWLHVAIDRFTGKVVDQQLEPVVE